MGDAEGRTGPGQLSFGHLIRMTVTDGDGNEGEDHYQFDSILVNSTKCDI